MQQARKVTIAIKDADLDDVLKLCFKDQPLNYKIVDKTVIVKAKLTDDNTVNVHNSAIDVNGRVVNEKGEPVAGATIKVKGTNTVAISGSDGEFLLSGIDDNAILIISGAEIETMEVRIGKRNSISATVKTKENELDKVVIMAYGTTTKRLNTGNISKVTADDIGKQPVSNTLAAIEGRVPGLSIIQNTGVPGGGFTVQIRGRNSIANGNNPFYVVDGVPFSSTLPNNTNRSIGVSNILLGGNPLNSINPADIESIEILKDADATAIYGSRGANGVILITTKRGKAGKTNVNLNVYSGIGKVAHFMDMLSTQQYLAMRREAFANDGATPTISNARDLLQWDTARYTDWQKLLMGGTAHYTDIQSSISGGNQNTQFVIGGGFHKETTVDPGNFYDQRTSVRFSLNHISNNQKFAGSVSANYVVDQGNLYSYNLSNYLGALIPNAPAIYDSEGKLNWENGTFSNPFNELLKKFRSTTRNIVSNAMLKYQVVQNLSLKINLGYTRMQLDEIQTNPLSSFNPFSGYTSNDVYTDFGSNSIETWIIEPQAEYKIHLNKGLLSVLVGTTLQSDVMQGQTLEATGFNNDGLVENMAAASSILVKNANYSQYKYSAIFGKINYNWEDKYLINLTGRRDGSSRFGPDRQFANFGALGAAWIFSNEKFIKENLKFLSFGKLRTSYGTTGNDQLDPYQYLSSWQATYYPYQGNGGLQPARLTNSDYSWEINKKLEFGLALGFLNDRISLTASFYNNRSSNQLVGYPLPSSTGFTSIQYNLPAVVQNTGLEFELYTVNFRKKNLAWSSSFNITLPRNKLVSYPNLESSNYAYTYEVGKSLTVVKAFHLTGVDPQAGVYQFQDIDKDGSSTPTYPGDLSSNKKIAQDFYGGFSNTLQYKGWRLNVFFQFVKQTGYNYLYSFGAPGKRSNQPVVVLNRWQKEGNNSSIQKFTQSAASQANIAYDNNRYFGDGAIGDASFARLKNLAISYQFQESKWKSKLGLNNLSIYVEVQNLFTFTNYSGLDPETQSFSLPPLRVFATGIQITF